MAEKPSSPVKLNSALIDSPAPDTLQSAPATAALPAVHVAARAKTARLFFSFFVFLNFLFLLTSTGRIRTMDEVMTLFQAESLVLRGNTAVPQAVSANLFFGKYDRDGQPRAGYAPAHSVAATPWYAFGRYVLCRLPGVPPAARNQVLDFAVTLSSATLAALAAALAFLIFCRLRLSDRTALLAAAMLALATPLFAYSAWFFSEPLAAAILLGAAWVLFGLEEGRAISSPRALLAGALLGVAVWVRPTHVVAALVFLVALLVRERGRGIRAALIVAAASGILGGAYLLRNVALFGNPLDFGYPEFAEGGKRLLTFETPLTVGLFGFLFSPGKSVFVFAPPILLALYGLPRLWRRDRGLGTLAALAPVAYLLFYARYTQWEGGYCFGPRFLVPAIALLCLAVGPALAEATPRVRRFALVLFVAGFLVQGIGLATSFLEDQAGGGYYDQQWNYKLSHFPLVGQGRLLAHYLTSAVPAPLGRGFDRWFVFLAKAGVARGTLAVIGLLMAAGAAFSAWRLRRALAPPQS